MSGFIPDGYCGLYCAACPQYLATQAGLPPEPGLERCQGCRSDVVASAWCAVCTHKACAKAMGVEFCYQCDEYPCPDLQSFIDDPNWPYHTEVVGYMETIRTCGKDEWIRQMKERWSCPSCGMGATWWDRACRGCGAALDGYARPAS